MSHSVIPRANRDIVDPRFPRSIHQPYGDPPPATVITVGLDRSYLGQFFEQCTMAGTITNSYGIDNDLANPSAIYVCRKVRLPWDKIWEKIKRYS